MNEILDCVLCENKFSEDDVVNFSFFIQTRICYHCYKALYKANESVSCFGKQYDAFAEECRLHCPDRKICPKFHKLVKLRKLAESETESQPTVKPTYTTRKFPFREGSIIDRAFKLCMQGIEKKKLKNIAKRYGTNYYRLVRVLKQGQKYGKKWSFQDSGNTFKLEYDLRKKKT